MYPTLRDTLEQTADKYPDKDALIYPRRDQRWTYAEFDAKANQLANALAEMGIEKGDRVSTMLHNGTEIVLTVFACAKLGAVFNPLNYRLPAGEIEYILNDAGSSALIFEEGTREAVAGAREALETVEQYLYIDEDGPEWTQGFYERLSSSAAERPDTVVEEDDIYAFIYTSGTTGRPKGVVHEHRDMVEHNLICIGEGGIRRDDVGLSAFPLYHCAELQAALFPRIHVGATSVIHHDFDPVRALQAIDEHDVTLFFAAPTGWNALVQAAEEVEADLSSLRLGLYGAAPMPQEVLDGCMAVFDAGYLQAYGMTEIGPCGTFQYPEDQVDKRGSAGLPALNHDLRIVEPDGDPTDEVEQGEIGEILFAGPCTMREYWNRPDATEASLREADGREWYYTGDLGYLDEDGYLYVVDRKDDMIITGGENVYPTDVEDVLYAHDDVVEAAVVGEPHEEWGEQVVAYVVGDVSQAELDQYLKESTQLADFKRPRTYNFVDELPKNPSGKVQKFKLRSDGAEA
ncbi:long-chain-fatty-acid--CoA ligase [Halovenus sp. WSH3]|uniref:Long-chain-fatty-acid--CoA ligase n=1 Tax=Halovenus carboxidivorans TaxID=2692199 RepID=A0A6B0TI01_9EURY|nr:long-chain-fatty-acid--CoA ligase [Halovenus carboxidivorans]MXR52839.1 long-chain-fatty-acid--CoA ligase [Halovenus carboxidivorans]